MKCVNCSKVLNHITEKYITISIDGIIYKFHNNCYEKSIDFMPLLLPSVVFPEQPVSKNKILYF